MGVWSNRFNWEVAEEVLKAERDRARARGERTTKLYVLDKDGTVLGSDKPEDVLQKRVADSPLFGRASKAKASGFAQAKALDGSGTDVLAGWFHSAGFSLYPGLDWSIVATQDREEALAAAGRLARDTLLIALLAALMIAALAFVIARVVARRIAGYSGFAGAVAQGDLTQRLEPKGQDELAELAVNLNQMAEGLTSISGQMSEGATTLSSSTAEMLATVNQNTAAASEQSRRSRRSLRPSRRSAPPPGRRRRKRRRSRAGQRPQRRARPTHSTPSRTSSAAWATSPRRSTRSPRTSSP